MGEGLLARINSPEDLKPLDLRSLEQLAGEIRQIIVSTVEKSGGHSGAKLGGVELTVALRAVRAATRGGLSGFPLPSESAYDHFWVGHSSTSISAAAGMVIARDLRGEDYQVGAVSGDGALTGGMAFEALNQIGS